MRILKTLKSFLKLSWELLKLAFISLFSPPENHRRLETIIIIAKYWYYKFLEISRYHSNWLSVIIGFLIGASLTLLQIVLAYFVGKYTASLVGSLVWVFLFPLVAIYIYQLAKKSLEPLGDLPKGIQEQKNLASSGEIKINTIFTLLFILLALPVFHFGLFYSITGIYRGDELITALPQCLYFSASTFVTLGVGDFIPPASAQGVVVLEAILGYVYLGLLIVIIFDLVSPLTKRSQSSKENEVKVEKSLNQKKRR